MFVRNVFYFSKKVRLFSQNDVLFLFYFLINLAGTTVTCSTRGLGLIYMFYQRFGILILHVLPEVLDPYYTCSTRGVRSLFYMFYQRFGILILHVLPEVWDPYFTCCTRGLGSLLYMFYQRFWILILLLTVSRGPG